MFNDTQKQREFRTYRADASGIAGVRDTDVIGEVYQKILNRVTKLISHHRSKHLQKGIKGYIFHGDVGVGKTTVAKAIAHKLGYPLIFIDGTDIARPLYGQAEMQISEAFNEAQKMKRCIILIDDCESVFPARDFVKAESWHIAQNNVFFHELDQVDTTKLTVILTTNRYDLLDVAIKDRLYSIEFPQPDHKALKAIAEVKCREYGLPTDKAYISIEADRFTSVRGLEKFLLEEFVHSAVEV